MKNYSQKGEILEYKNTSGNKISSGDVIPLATRICVAVADIENNESGSVQLEGVVNLPKKAEIVSFGDELHFDTVTKSLTKTPSANTKYAGMAAEDAPSNAATINCRLQSGSYSSSGE